MKKGNIGPHSLYIAYSLIPTLTTRKYRVQGTVGNIRGTPSLMTTSPTRPFHNPYTPLEVPKRVATPFRILEPQACLKTKILIALVQNPGHDLVLSYCLFSATC